MVGNLGLKSRGKIGFVKNAPGVSFFFWNTQCGKLIGVRVLKIINNFQSWQLRNWEWIVVLLIGKLQKKR